MSNRQNYYSVGVYTTAIVLYAISFFLPVTVGDGEVWLGWKVAIVSLHPVVVWWAGVSNIGFILGVIGLPSGRLGFATAALLLAVVSMVLCGILVPEKPSHEMIRYPSGQLTAGYYCWLASGVLMLVEAYRAAWLQFVASRSTAK